MPRNHPRRTRRSVTYRITEDEPEIKDEAAPVDTIPDFINNIRSQLLQKVVDEGDDYHQIHVSIAATSTQGLEVDSLTFVLNNNRWGIHCNSSQTHVWEDTIGLAWKKAFEQLTTKTTCTTCGNVVRVGDPCVPCGIRKLIATSECTVCKEDKHNFYHLLCGHSFCKDCLKRTSPQKCPLCRASFKMNDGMAERDCACGHCESDDDDE
jgi:hypothetical protein